MTIRNSKDSIRVLLYSYYTTITGWGVLQGWIDEDIGFRVQGSISQGIKSKASNAQVFEHRVKGLNRNPSEGLRGFHSLNLACACPVGNHPSVFASVCGLPEARDISPRISKLCIKSQSLQPGLFYVL